MNFKEALNKEKHIIKDSDFTTLNEGFNNFVFGKRIFHTYYRKSSKKKLYVFLSAIGRKESNGIYPVFHRNSWESVFDGNVLCFDDPTRREIDFAPAFYFGDKHNNALEEICTIVNRLIDVLDINTDDVCFISSSNGGFAAIYLANMVKKSTCLALCPQFDVENYLGENTVEFYEKLEINPGEYKDRLNLFNVMANNESKFIIYSNIKDGSDKKQIELFCKKNNIKYKIGLNKIKDNFFFIIVDIDAYNPHLAQPGALFCNFIIEKLFTVKTEDIDLFVNRYIEQMTKSRLLDLKNNISLKILEAIDDVDKIDFNNDFVDVFIGGQFEAYFRIRNYKSDFIQPSLRVINWKAYASIENIKKFAENNGISIDYNDKLVNFYRKEPIEFQQLNTFYRKIKEECFGFLLRTYP